VAVAGDEIVHLFPSVDVDGWNEAGVVSAAVAAGSCLVHSIVTGTGVVTRVGEQPAPIG
jgi:hypothetical protein